MIGKGEFLTTKTAQSFDYLIFYQRDGVMISFIKKLKSLKLLEIDFITHIQRPSS